MLISDLVIALVFTLITAIGLFLGEDKITNWQKTKK